jgi:two-component system chemotaxis response regulator CheB
MIRVLIVEDSVTARELLKHILSSDPEIEVVGTVENGLQAVEFVSRDKPDVVTMDIIMPKMDGYEATRRIMETNPVPIVVVSVSVSKEEVERTWRAVEAGAVAVLEKPRAARTGVPGNDAETLVRTVKTMAQVKVVRRWKKNRLKKKPETVPARGKVPAPAGEVRIVAIGASTGGPSALHKILGGLPAEFPVPILLVQHISPGFAEGFVAWLDEASDLNLRLATDRERILPGCVYVAPDGCRMTVGRFGRISVAPDESPDGIKPSASHLFRSVAQVYREKAVGILLTGMGGDGAEELKLMRDGGAVTIAQDKESCVVYGMPGEAVKLGAAVHSLSPEGIRDFLKRIAERT